MDMAAELTKSLGETIRRAFRKNGMSMRRLSLLSETNYSSVHGFFTAERDVTLSTIQSWCDVLGLELRAKKGR